MKKIKYLIYFLIVVILGVIIYQNWSYFEVKSSLTFNIKILKYHLFSYQAPELANIMFFVGCFLAGFFWAYFAGLFSKFKASRILKELDNTINSQQEKISTLRGEIAQLKKTGNTSRTTVEDMDDEDAEQTTTPDKTDRTAQETA